MRTQDPKFSRKGKKSKTTKISPIMKGRILRQISEAKLTIRELPMALIQSSTKIKSYTKSFKVKILLLIRTNHSELARGEVTQEHLAHVLHRTHVQLTQVPLLVLQDALKHCESLL